MNIIFGDDDPQSVSRRWDAQYNKVGTASKHIEIGNQLRELPESASAKQIDQIIGNQSWTHVFCNECTKYYRSAIHFDDGDSGIFVCRRCIKAAFGIVSKVKA